MYIGISAKIISYNEYVSVANRIDPVSFIILKVFNILSFMGIGYVTFIDCNLNALSCRIGRNRINF